MRIAMLQMNSGIDPAHNAATLVQAIADAAAHGAVMLFAPEMANLLDRDRDRSSTQLHQQADDPTLRSLCDAARRHRLWVQPGSFAFRSDADPTRRVNRAMVIDDLGAIRTHYDKVHLFDVDLPTGESWRESAVYDAGEQLAVVDTPWARVGLSICYDLRFPLLYQQLADAGATILTVPAAFTRPTGQAHWHILLRARAIEQQCFVIAAAQTGHHEDGRETYGHSLVIDPWGNIVADAGEMPGLTIVDLDLAAVDDVRARIPVHQHRQNLPCP